MMKTTKTDVLHPKKTLLSDKDEAKREEKRIHPGHRETPAKKEEETKDGRCNLMDPLE